MLDVIKPASARDPHFYLLRHISKEKVYYKYYKAKELLQIPECVISYSIFRNRLSTNTKHYKIHGCNKYSDIWDLITRPLSINQHAMRSIPKPADKYAFDVNAWPAI